MALAMARLSPKKPVVVKVNYFDDAKGVLGSVEIYHSARNPPGQKYKPLARYLLKVDLRDRMTQNDIMRAVRVALAKNQWAKMPGGKL